jgi:hypothetical protein
MSGQKPILNSVPNEPTLSDLLDLLKKEIFLDLNCHHVGTIQSFQATTQTVYATVNYTKTYFQLNTATGLYGPVQVNYPTLINCPLIVLRGGPVSLTFPIAKGDECILIFNDRDIDSWFANGSSTQAVASARLHAFTDAFALVGVKSTPNVLTAYDTVRAILTNGNVKLGINPVNNKVTIQNNTTSLGTVLGNLKTALSTLSTSLNTVATALGTNPSIETAAAAAGTSLAAASVALTTSLTSLQTLITGLLE